MVSNNDILLKELQTLHEIMGQLLILSDFFKKKDYIIEKDNNLEITSDFLIEIEKLFNIGTELTPIISNLKVRCNHRLIPHLIDATTPAYQCIDCGDVFEAYTNPNNMNLSSISITEAKDKAAY